jgi:hypothetical protein
MNDEYADIWNLALAQSLHRPGIRPIGQKMAVESLSENDSNSGRDSNQFVITFNSLVILNTFGC